MNQTLTELNLRGTRTVNLIALRNQVSPAGDEAVLAIGESLKVNQTLQKLDLGVWVSVTVVNCFIYKICYILLQGNTIMIGSTWEFLLECLQENHSIEEFPFGWDEQTNSSIAARKEWKSILERNRREKRFKRMKCAEF